MNTRSFLLALCVAASSTALAQGGTTITTPQATVDRSRTQHDAMVKELGLTPEQDTKMLQSEERYRQSAKELNAAGLDTQARQERARALRDGRDKEIQAILSAEQYQKFLAMRKEKRSDGLQRVQEAQPAHQE